MPPIHHASWKLPPIVDVYDVYPSDCRSQQEVTRRSSSRARLEAETEAGDRCHCDSEICSKQRRGVSSARNSRRRIAFQVVNAMVWSAMVFLVYRHQATHPVPRAFIPEAKPELVTRSMIAEQPVVPQVQAPLQSGSEPIHIIHTRFMQHQPHLVDLGLARLELLQAFTLASLNQQTHQNFLWVIRTDPALNDTLREPLLAALENHDHHLLLASNEVPNLQIHDLLSIEPSMVWSGNLQKARSYLNGHVNGDRTVLESRLDADDGLHEQFVEVLQQKASEMHSYRSWRFICSLYHVEWQPHVVWQDEATDRSMGALLSLKDKGCITAGLALAYTKGVQLNDLPPVKHHQLGKSVRPCNKRRTKSCLDYLDIHPTALRARTPTSAGMLNILVGEHAGKVDQKYLKGAISREVVQDTIWKVVEPAFGFHPDTARDLRSYLQTHVREIAKDNLLGQCTAGHSCKESSKRVLRKIVDHPESVV